MSYSDLYSQFAEETRHVKRTEFKDAAIQIMGINKISVMRTEMDTSICRGCFLKPTNTEHPFVKRFGGNIIVTARGMNRCWDRFVYCKELMHIFSSGDDCADTGEGFEDLMTDLTNYPNTPSAQFQDEQECFWRALALICPEGRRDEFQKRLLKYEISEHDIALQLKIPEVYVPRLFWLRFDEFLEKNNLKR